MSECAFRRMVLEDIDRILEIEHASFPTPWSRSAFEGELKNNHFAHYVVVEWNERVVGYAGMWVIMDEAHITNIAIEPEMRGRKLGEKLLRHMMRIAWLKGAERITLEVRVSNRVAQNLYKKLGFTPQGVRKGYYSDNQEDALIMWSDLIASDLLADSSL
ncbi:ribosomal-protein-alanine acetyltransferase [Collibacillus ludicampi]|uniref:Ribosomal-protein-alanine acetyltransferase n=1 Tax=Collibacillus ludicampi TaxID=2771369 RepID=A0AAV4LFR6_9BACL|nr:ribosomal protein S18-alanine N-acetyltransferase [Collibacillus ludicampi]GIM46302.1 ribosomal-protein-alanine acetyltransferase [Collibacillus ludicampi]